MEGMVFEREGVTRSGLGLGPAAGLALMEELGIPDIIDSACSFDAQRILTPGKAAKAIIGTMLTQNAKKAMRNVAPFYSMAPVDRLFGERVEHRSLNDSALGRNLETIFQADTDMLLYSIASRVKGHLHLASNLVHFDPSNVTIARSAGDEYGELPEGAPIPKLGRPKDGSTDRVQYNFCAGVDNDGIPLYMKAHDGNIDDNSMISDAVKFVEKLMANDRLVAVGDGKLVTKALVQHMMGSGTLFASKPPQPFARNVAGRVAEEALRNGFRLVGKVGSRKDSPEYEVYDTDSECYGNTLRFVAYRKMDRRKKVRHMKRIDGHHVEEITRGFVQKSFGSQDDAEKAVQDAVSRLKDSAWALRPTIRSRKGYNGGTEWKVSFSPRFDEDYAKKLVDRDVEVIVTNIPRADATGDDLSKGASARDIIAIYTGQWRVEGLFSEMKSGLGADEVFFQNPDREAVMLFLLTVGAMVRRALMIKLRREYGKGYGIPDKMTSARFFAMVQNVDVTMSSDGRCLRLEGSDEDRANALSLLDALGIDPSRLLG